MFVLHVLMSRHQGAASAAQVSPRKKPLSSLDVDWDAISWKSERGRGWKICDFESSLTCNLSQNGWALVRFQAIYKTWDFFLKISTLFLKKIGKIKSECEN